MAKRPWPGEVVKFTIGGVLFGLFFPLFSTTIEMATHNTPFTFSEFFLTQRGNPLLWIIDTAVPILGFIGFLIGKQQQNLRKQADYLEQQVAFRSEAILKQKLFYEALVENSPIAIVTLDPQHRVLSANPAFEEIFGFTSLEILGENLDDIVSNHEARQEAHNITRGILQGKTMHEFGQRRRKDGTLVDVDILGKPIELDGEQIGVLGLYRDITSEKTARDALEASEERFRSLFQNSPVALRLEDCSALHAWVHEKQASSGQPLRDYLEAHPEEIMTLLALPRIISLNAATLSLFRAKSKEDLQERIGLILSEESLPSLVDIVSSLIAGETSIEQELVYDTLDGNKKYMITRLTVLPGYESDWGRVMFSNLDITDRKLAEERMSYISLHDMMTGLYNRSFFDEEMARLDKSRIRPVTILVCDMDNLKEINDRFGHKTGDIALQNIANILKNCFRAEDVVARIGGDEFCVLLPSVSAELAERVIQRIYNDVEMHNMASTMEERVTLSIGSCTANKGKNLIDTFKAADQSMYAEKQNRKGGNG